MTPTVAISEGSTMQRILTLSSHESSEHWEPARGILNARHLKSTVIDPYGAGQNFRRVMIDILPENTLLEIFDFYRLDAEKATPARPGLPWKWKRLAHVCRKWRHVLFMSPRRLGLQIYCKTGRPIKPILDSWPTLPLVVRANHGKSKSPKVHRNIIIALRHSDRVCNINLTMPTSMIPSIVDVLQRPFPNLERIKITTDFEGPRPPVVTEFLGGSAPRLKVICLSLGGVVIPFPVLRQLLLSTINLVELRLSDVTSAGYFSPDTLITVLSHPTLARLVSLDVSFHLSASRSTPNRARSPPLERATLPSLTSLSFHGPCDYLEGFVARIDTPALIFIRIELYNQLIFEVQQLSSFIVRAHRLNSFSEVRVHLWKSSANIQLVQKVTEMSCIGIKCRGLDWQLSFITEILGYLSASLSSVDVLRIYRDAPGGEDVDSTQFLELFRLCTHVSTVRVSRHVVPGVAHALATEDMAAGVLPRLTSLTLNGYRNSSSVVEAAKKFVVMRKRSGQNVSLHFG